MREIEGGEVRQLCDVAGDFADVVVGEDESFEGEGPEVGGTDGKVGEVVVGGI